MRTKGLQGVPDQIIIAAYNFFQPVLIYLSVITQTTTSHPECLL
jgi:hypothetical protein